MATNTPFRALFVPPADPFADPGQRADIDELRRIVTAIPDVPTPVQLNAARAGVAAQASAVLATPTIIANINAWVDNTVQAFKRMYLDYPNPNAIYFIISSEFAMNGWRENLAHPISYNAVKPFPVAVEEDIRTKLLAKLDADARIKGDNLRIVIAFSFNTYENVIVPPGGSRGAAWFTILASNHLNVLWRDGVATGLRHIHKREPAPVDIWPADLFTPRLQWNSITSAPQSIPGYKTPSSRVEHIRVKLSPWKDGNGTNIYVSFATCYDLGLEVKHGDCNLCVYVGAGFPLDCIKDTIHPFLMSDTTWKTNDVDYANYVASGGPALVGLPGHARRPRDPPTNKPGYYVCTEPDLEEIAWLDNGGSKHIIAPGSNKLLSVWDQMVIKWPDALDQVNFGYIRNLCRVDAAAPPGSTAHSQPSLTDGEYVQTSMYILPNRRPDKGGKKCSIL